MEETQVLNTEQVPTGGNDSKVAAERVKQLHDALVADEVMKDYVPNDFRRFVEVYKDPKNMNSLYDALSADDVFKDYIPDSKERMYDLYVLGKQKSEPAKEPSQSSVLQSPSNGGVEFGFNQTISAEKPKPNVLAKPQPLSPQIEQQGFDIPIAANEEIRFAPEKEIEYKSPASQLEANVRKFEPSVQGVTKEMSINKNELIKTENELKTLEEQLNGFKKQSDSLAAIYQNESLTPQERNKAVDEYNKLNKEAAPLSDRYNKLANDYNGYVNKEKELFGDLDKAEKMRQKGLEKEYDHIKNLKEATESAFVSTAAGIGGILTTLFVGDPEDPESIAESQTKAREGLSKLKEFGDSLITQETPENYKKMFEGDFSAGKLAYITTNAVSSTVPTVAAGLLTGGAGSVVAGAGLGFDESKNIMKEAGLDEEQSNWASLALAIPIGFLEKYGADDVVRLLNSSGLKKQVASELAKKIAGKTLTREAIFTEAKKTFGEVIKDKSSKLLRVAVDESLTEMGQGQLNETAKQIVQEFTGVDKDENISTEDYVKQQLLQRAEEGAGGFLGGTTLGGAGTAYNSAFSKTEFTPSAYIKAMEFADPAKFEQFKNDLASEVQAGVLTAEKADNALSNVQAIQETNNLIPKSVQDLDLRTDAVNLIIEKNDLMKEIEGKDPDLITVENTRLAEIKKSLNDISLGVKPKVEEVAAQPTTEEAQAPQETEQATKLGIDSFSDEANDFISREKEDLKRDVDYFKKEVEERKPKTTLGKLNDKFDRVVMRYKPYVEVELEIIQKKLDLLEKNPLEYYKNEIDETIKDDDSDSERKDRNIKYYQEIIDYLEQERITPTTETKTTENAIQEQPTTQEVPRPGEGGQNIPEGGQGVRPSEQGQETAQQGKEEVISEPTIDQQFQDVKDKNFVTFNYKNESEVPDILKGKISSKGENNGVPFVKVTLPKSLADYYLQTQKLKQDEKTEKGPMLEGLQATGDEGKGGQAGAELRTEAKGKKEIEELAEPIVIFKGNTGKLNPDGSRRTAHPNIKGVFGSTDLKSAERYGNDISKFDIPKGTTVETVEIKNKKIPLSEARKQETELVNASDAQIVRLITYDAKGREVQYIIKDKSILQQNKPIKNAEEVLTIKQQIENFGVAPEMVEPVNGVISQVFESLKKAGLTAAKNVGEWIGIGKGKEKSYSLKINGNDVQVKNVQPEVVNGFYSPLEKIINEAKQDKMPAKQWADKYANSEEAKWTGLKDWLSQQQGSVSKADIQQYLKDNRISVVEVVKGGGRPEQSIINDIEKEGYTLEGSLGEEGYVIMDKEGEMAEYDELPDNVRKLYDELSTVTISDASGTKFSQYQLEGEKSNYKEVLVTLPNRTPLTFEEFKARAQKETSMDDYEVKAAYKNYIAKGDFSKLAPNQFKSSHFDEPNILVHLRMNTRTDAEGNKVLFLEEVQSDWGQQGKKEGFSKNIKELPSDYKIKSRRLYNKDNTFSEYFEVINPQGKLIANADTEIEAKEKALRMLNRIGTPTAPFVMDTNAWTKLGLKVALKEAVAQGADKIAWTTGEQQNERYDLRKQVDEIYYSKTKDGAYRVWAKKDGNIIFKENSMQEKELEQNFGKDVAEKIINDKGQSQEGLAGKKLSGNDLAVGGKGMKGFYGSPTEGTLGIVGNVAKSLFKQEVGTVEIQTEVKIDGGELKSKDQNYKINDLGEGDFELIYKNKNLGSRFGLESVKELANEHRQQNLGLEGDVEWGGKNVKATQYSIDITPELRASVEDGQPLFKDAQAQYRIENGQNVIEAIKDFDGSPEAVVALTHEIMHPTVVAIIDGAAEGNEVGTRHTQTIVDEFNKANPKSKVTVDELIAGNNAFREGTTSEQYRDVQEFIAESWEKYHTEGGKGFSEAFQKVLEQITEAFRAVYKTLTGKQLTPELRQMFDEILGKEAAKVETDAFADLANQFGEAAKEAVKAEVVTAETFADISQTGKAGRDARESARKKFGKDAVAKMEEISRNFDKLIEQLESENKVRKECP